MRSVRAVVFDAYGTLLDLDSAIAPHATRLGAASAQIAATWRQKQLEATWILSLTGDYEPFDRITDRALGFAFARHGIEDAALRSDLLQAFRGLDAYADAGPLLDGLARRGLVRAVLSNGSPSMLADGLHAAGLASRLEHVLSVDPLRRYKPHPSVYATAAHVTSCQPHEILFVSANAWDAFGAARFGFQVARIDRTGAPVEYWLDALATTVPGLHAVEALLG